MSVNRIMRLLFEFNFADFVTVENSHIWSVKRKSYTLKVLSTLIEKISEFQNPINDLKKTLLKNISKTLAK